MRRSSLHGPKLGAAVLLGGMLLAGRPALAQRGNPIGTATGTQLATCPSDPGGVSGNCWGLNVSCPLVTPIQPYDATLKVTIPSGASTGTIIFITGGGGVGFYDTQFTYGAGLINALVRAGFTTVQVVFDNQVAGWLTGPAKDGNGPLSLACLPSTAMQWVHDNILTSGTPLCATGNSGGSFAIAYALSQYGLGSIFSMAELSSGPEMSRIDQGCAAGSKYVACAICGSGTQPESYGLSNAENFVDPAYTGVVTGKANGPCSMGIKGSTQNASLFHHDSILSDTSTPILSFPPRTSTLSSAAKT